MTAANDIVKHWTEAFRNADSVAFSNVFAEDAVQEHPFFPDVAQGRAEIHAREAGLFDAFSDITFELRQVVESGDRALIEAFVSATNTGPIPTPAGALPATGKRIRIPMASVVRLNGDGSIAEEHRYLDVAGFMGQLGVGG